MNLGALLQAAALVAVALAPTVVPVRAAAGGMLAAPVAAAARTAHWAIVNSPNKGKQSSVLRSVTCPAVHDCWAVGSYNDKLGLARTLIEHYTGDDWAIVSSPNKGSHQANSLSGVTCTGRRNCWAVGYHGGDTLIEHYTGDDWAIVSSPSAGSLTAVTCVDAHDCWAVGGHDPDTLIEHYSGNGWIIVSSPNNVNTVGYDALADVTCTSHADCWAVGFYTDPHDQTLIEHYTGSGWTIVNSPNLVALQSLSGVSCGNPSNCWAVGFYDESDVPTLIDHYAGSDWVIANSPNTGTLQSLSGVTCADPSDCWAVGNATSVSSGVDQAFIVRYSGGTWAVDSSPDPGTATSTLSSVTCVNARDCWAVGASLDAMGIDKTLIEHFSRKTVEN